MNLKLQTFHFFFIEYLFNETEADTCFFATEQFYVFFCAQVWSEIDTFGQYFVAILYQFMGIQNVFIYIQHIQCF